MVAFISFGSIQLLVGPASSSRSEQMNVRSSTRATSLGSEAAQYELGLAFNGTNVPASTSSALMRSASSSEPSTHTTRSGVVSSATSRTQESTPLCVVGALSRPGMATAVISTPVFDDKSPHRTRSGCGLRCRDRMAQSRTVEAVLLALVSPRLTVQHERIRALTCRFSHKNDKGIDSDLAESRKYERHLTYTKTTRCPTTGSFFTLSLLLSR